MTSVLVVGSGGREHAIAWRLARDGASVHAAPGNAGTARVGTNHDVAATDLHGLVALARSLDVDLVVIGPEAPLVAGLADQLRDAGVACFGPGAAAARLEGSKVFSKEKMLRYGVPTGAAGIFDDADAALAHLRSTWSESPCVVKADGLAGGKGVIVPSTLEEAEQGIAQIMRERAFGDAGARVLLEERLVGQEVSYHVVCDGRSYVALAPAQDHKRAFEGDGGPNTGGMGAVSPPAIVDAALEARIQREVVEPMLAGLRDDGLPMVGALFIGLMIVDGAPKVLEFNVRFGDPETQCLMTRWGGSALALFEGAARGDLSGVRTEWSAPASLCVVVASEGYPGAYPKGVPIAGLEEADAIEGAQVFCAGVREADDGPVTSGGRVLGVTGVGEDVDQAAARAYAAVDRLCFRGMHFRRDIGHHSRT